MTGFTEITMGTLYCRQKRGRKLRFIVGGGFPDMQLVLSGIRWDMVERNQVFEFHGDNGTFTLLPPDYFDKLSGV